MFKRRKSSAAPPRKDVNWIPVTAIGISSHSDAPSGSTVFSGDNFGRPVHFYLTGGPARSTRRLLEMAGRPIELEVDGSQILDSPPVFFPPNGGEATPAFNPPPARGATTPVSEREDLLQQLAVIEEENLRGLELVMGGFATSISGDDPEIFDLLFDTVLATRFRRDTAATSEATNPKAYLAALRADLLARQASRADDERDAETLEHRLRAAQVAYEEAALLAQTTSDANAPLVPITVTKVISHDPDSGVESVFAGSRWGTPVEFTSRGIEASTLAAQLSERSWGGHSREIRETQLLP